MADYIYYVNPDSAASGNGTTDTLSGGNHAYQTLNAAVTARAGTHGSGNTITYRCSGNGSNWIDSTGVDLSSHTEDSVTVEGYNGNFSGYNDSAGAYDNTSYYALEVNTQSTHTLDIGGVDNVTITKLQINNTNSSNFYYTITDNVSTTDNATVTKCRVKSDKTNSAKSGGGIRLRGGLNKAATINNNVVIGNGNSNSDNIGIEPGKGTSGAESVVANNTISTFQVGIQTFNFLYYKFRNNAIVSCADDWNFAGSETITASNNADSNDGDTPGSNNTTCVITDATDFTAPSTGDYTVYDTGSNLYDAGTTSDAPSDDITGTSRSATYDIGAFEYVSGGTTVPAAQAESSAASDSQSATVAATAAITETAGASDSQTVTGALQSAITESAAAADSQSATNAGTAAQTETAAASDTQARTVNRAAEITESAGVADSSSGILVFPVAITESASAADSQSASVAATAAITESAAAGDTQSATVAASASITESAGATDGQSASSALVASATESAAVADSPDAQVSGGAIPAAITETAAASDTQSAQNAALAAIAESAAVSDSSTATVAAIASITESAAASESSNGVIALIEGAVTESAGISDSQDAVTTFAVSATESAAASDAQSATNAGLASISESAGASDLQSAFATGLLKGVCQESAQIIVRIDALVEKSAPSATSAATRIAAETAVVESATNAFGRRTSIHPPKTPPLDRQGKWTSEWYRFIHELWERTGGADDAVEESQQDVQDTQDQVSGLTESVGGLEADVDTQNDQVILLRESVLELQADAETQNDQVTLLSELTIEALETAEDAETMAQIAMQQTIDSGVPVGGIVLWYGTASAIPSGYAICDGSSGTPDMRNLVPIGAGDTFSVGDTGGTDDPTTLTTDVPSATTTVDNDGAGSTVAVGSGTHTHDLDIALTDKYDLIPHRALYFIQRIR